MWLATVVTLLVFCFFVGNYGYKILFVAPTEASSHRGSVYPLAVALKNRGHDVTIFSEAVIDHKENEGPVKEVLVKLKVVSPDFVQGVIHQNTSEFLKILWEINPNVLMLGFIWKGSSDCCSSLLTHQHEEFWQIANGNWDLVIVDNLFSPCGIAIASLNPAPNAIFHTNLLDIASAEYRGLPGAPHFAPPTFAVPKHVWLAGNFFDRFWSLLESKVWHLVNSIIVQWLTNSAIGHLVPKFSFSSYTRDAGIAFIDYPESFDWPRPKGMDSIYVGSSCKMQGKPLSEELQEFVDDPKSKGTILVAFGTMGNWAIAPEHVSRQLFEALAQMTDYRIIFQYKGDPSIFPGHIKAMTWLPQEDILLHPKTRLFITHGGLKSLKETVCAEVPGLYLPLIAEQLRNALAAEVLGFGERLDKTTFESKTTVSKMKQILESTSNQLNIRKVKARLLDHPIPQLDEGVFWTEYIIRRKGMPSVFHRKSKDLYWFQYLCLDIALVVVVSTVILILMSIRVIQRLLSIYYAYKCPGNLDH